MMRFSTLFMLIGFVLVFSSSCKETKKKSDNEGLSYDMVFVQGGSFYKKHNSGRGENIVKLSSFYIGKKEVTQELWIAVMGDNPAYSQGLHNPVESVSYEDVLEFIDKLNRLTGQKYRLPTNAEWEYAARGGNRSRGYWERTDDDIYSITGRDLPNPNELGIYDMTTSVCEWVSDKFSEDYYERDNPQGPKITFWRPLYCYRGGYFNYRRLKDIYTTFSGDKEDFAYEWLGFRLAKSMN